MQAYVLSATTSIESAVLRDQELVERLNLDLNNKYFSILNYPNSYL